LPKLKRKLPLRNATLRIKPLRRSWVIVNRVGLGAIARRGRKAIVRKVVRVVRIVVLAVVVKVVADPKDATKAGPAAAAADDLLKGSPKSN
jgi:hypothetical protein